MRSWTRRRERSANFDFIARPYRFLEYLALGPLLERTRKHFLPSLLDRRQALVLGDGDGRFLAALLQSNPHVRVDAVDGSAAMIQLLTQRCRPFLRDKVWRLRVHHTNALDYSPDRLPDLVVSHFFLDCLTQSETDRLVARLTPQLTPKAIWLVSDFRIPVGVMRLPSMLYIRLLYWGFRLTTGLRVTCLPDHTSALEGAGFALIASHRRLLGLLTTEIWQRTV